MEKMEAIKVRLKFDGCMSMKSQGSSGGLALLWRNEFDV